MNPLSPTYYKKNFLWRSHIHSDIIGSIAGITYYKMTYGHAARARVKPVDTNTNALEQIRAFFSAAVALFQALSPAERDAWEEYAAGTPWKNALGEDVNLTGQAMFIHTYVLIMNADVTTDPDQFKTAPCDPGLMPQPFLSGACCESPGFGVRLTIANTDDSLNMIFAVQISGPTHPSVRFYRGPYRNSLYMVTPFIVPGTPQTFDYCDLCEPGTYHFRVIGWGQIPPFRLCSPTYFSFDGCTEVV